MKSQFTKRREIIKSVISGRLTTVGAGQLLFCHPRTVKRCKKAFQTLGDAGLVDHRRSHNYKLTENERLAIINLKKHHLWYESLARWGLPDAILQDEGSQFKARTRFGQADYQWYAKQLGIKLIWARRAQTKGKIERFWRFVQDDFVREVWRAGSAEEVNQKFNLWLARYNWRFRSRAFAGQTRASRYRQSDRRISRVELQNLLVVEERRKVSRQSTISLYGQQYYIPPGYINCRIWVKVIGNKLLFEANNEVFWKTRLKTG